MGQLWSAPGGSVRREELLGECRVNEEYMRIIISNIHTLFCLKMGGSPQYMTIVDHLFVEEKLKNHSILVPFLYLFAQDLQVGCPSTCLE
jgi:hypothetical protein